MRSRNENFKKRIQLRQARIERLYRFSLAAIALGIGLVFLGTFKI
ncbi:MAG TPA: hypothetical protein VF427_00375 [Noviherbaspirillum sp.]